MRRKLNQDGMRWKCYVPSETQQVKMKMCLGIVELDVPVVDVGRHGELIDTCSVQSTVERG